MAVGLWDSSFKNAFHTLSYRFAAVILVILYSRGKGKELKDAEQGCIADTLTTKSGSDGCFTALATAAGHVLACRWRQSTPQSYAFTSDCLHSLLVF